MQARVRTVAFQGIDVLPVDVQVLVAPGQLAFAMVGLADKAVGESRERVRAAFRALGLALPPQRITVNLSPADLAKEGSHYDLPIALGLLAAMGVIPRESLAGFVVLGELALDGSLSRVPGVLPAAHRRPRGGARRDLPRGVRRRSGVGWLRHRRRHQRWCRAAADHRRAFAAGADQPPARPADPAGARRRWSPRIARAIPTSPRSRARRAPSACSSWRRPAATIS